MPSIRLLHVGHQPADIIFVADGETLATPFDRWAPRPVAWDAGETSGPSRRLMRAGEVVYEDDEHAVRWTLPGQRWRGFDLFVQDQGGGVTALMGIHAETRELAWLSPQGELSMDAVAVLDDDTLLVSTTMGRAFASLARFRPDARECAFLFDESWDERGYLLGDRLLVIRNEAGVDAARMYAWPSLAEMPMDLPRGGVFVDVGVADRASGDVGAERASGDVKAPGGASGLFGVAPVVAVWESAQHSSVVLTISGTARALSPMPDVVGIAPRTVRFRAADGEPLWAWALVPPDAQKTIVWLHDEGQARQRFRPELQALVARGFAVLVPDVRGSSGYGLPYQRAALRRFGIDPRDDVAAAMRWARTELGTPSVLLAGPHSNETAFAG